MDSEVVAIGLKMGGFGIKIALHDEANGDGITLTTKGNRQRGRTTKPTIQTTTTMQ